MRINSPGSWTSIVHQRALEAPSEGQNSGSERPNIEKHSVGGVGCGIRASPAARALGEQMAASRSSAACPSFASRHAPLVDMTGFSARRVDPSISGEGVIAGSCRTQLYDYLISYPRYDARGSAWSLEAAHAVLNATRKRGERYQVPLCGYGWSIVHSQALAGTTTDCPLVVDVGAHVGLSVLPAASRGLRVLAFEPTPRNMQLLKLNAYLNGWGGPRSAVGLVHAAVSNSNGSVRIFAPVGREDNSAIGTGDPSASTVNLGERTASVEHKVRAVSLDGYFGEAAAALVHTIRLVKIDTQGHELEVLRGMQGLLARTDLSFTVVLELNSALQRASGHTPEEVLQFMHHFGFRPFCEASDVSRHGQPVQRLVAVHHNGSHGTLPDCNDVVFRRRGQHPGQTKNVHNIAVR